jgi:hypothetical protein
MSDTVDLVACASLGIVGVASSRERHMMTES